MARLEKGLPPAVYPCSLMRYRGLCPLLVMLLVLLGLAPLVLLVVSVRVCSRGIGRSEIVVLATALVRIISCYHSYSCTLLSTGSVSIVRVVSVST